MHTTSVLVIEDDARIGPLVVSGLIKAGLQSQLMPSAELGIRAALSGQHHCVILDLGLPDLDGFAVLEAIRHRSSLPVIVLTARSALDARILAFDLGAVDWMAKPFYFEELLARIRVRLRMRAEQVPSRTLREGELEVNLDARVASIAGDELGLTPIEFNILSYLMERPGRAISRSALMDNVLDPDAPRSERTIDSHVSHLRQKLQTLGSRLVTVWGLGYRFEAGNTSAAGEGGAGTRKPRSPGWGIPQLLG